MRIASGNLIYFFSCAEQPWSRRSAWRVEPLRRVQLRPNASALVSAGRERGREEARPAAVNSLPCTLHSFAAERGGRMSSGSPDLAAQLKAFADQCSIFHANRSRQASGLGDRDKIPKMAQLHDGLPYLPSMRWSSLSWFLRERQGHPRAPRQQHDRAVVLTTDLSNVVEIFGFMLCRQGERQPTVLTRCRQPPRKRRSWPEHILAGHCRFRPPLCQLSGRSRNMQMR